VGTQNENINAAQCYKSADYRKGFSMTYHMRDMKALKPAQAGETFTQALLALACCASATALILTIGAATVCK
jgi:hypothetical protein